MKKPLDIKRCPSCQGRSFMNGYCLTCESDKANKANKNKGSLLEHAMNSLRIGFVK